MSTVFFLIPYPNLWNFKAPWLPSGEPRRNDGKSQFRLGQLTISIASLHSYVANSQRVYHVIPIIFTSQLRTVRLRFHVRWSFRLELELPFWVIYTRLTQLLKVAIIEIVSFPIQNDGTFHRFSRKSVFPFKVVDLSIVCSRFTASYGEFSNSKL